MRVVIADDSLLLREGLSRLLTEAGVEVVALAGDAEDLLRKVRAHGPDVAIVDIRMPPAYTDEGLRAARQIRTELPSVSVLVLSQYVEEEYAFSLLSEGAQGVGYLLKDRVTDLAAFLESLSRVARGGSVLDPDVVDQMLARGRHDDPLSDLTPREREVLALMAQGRTNGAIAADLVVTQRAIEKHVKSIFSKLDLPHGAEGHRRVMAVLAFIATG